jgi:hypothetical protein
MPAVPGEDAIDHKGSQRKGGAAKRETEQRK